MSTSPDLQKRAADPATSAQDLADLAAAHPDLQATIAANPSTYPGLLDWLRQYGGADVQAALDARERAAAPAAPPPPPPPTPAPAAPAAPGSAAPGFAGPAVPGYAAPAVPGAAAAYGYGAPAPKFVEPSRSIPITYLNHDLRYTLALVGVGLAGLLHALILPLAAPVISDAIFRSANYLEADYSSGTQTTYAVVMFLLRLLPWLLLGAAVFVLPSIRKNKMLALGFVVGPILIQFLAMILSVLSSAAYMSTYAGVLILSYLGLLFPAAAIAAWLAARMRPGVAYALLPITLLAIAFSSYSGFSGLGDYYYGYSAGPVTIVFGILGVGVLVGIAWLARLIAARKATGPTPEQRAAMYEAQQHAARVAHLQQWQAAAAHAATYGGPAPAAPGYPTAPPSTAPAAPAGAPPTPPVGPPTTPPSTPPTLPPS